MKKLLLAAAAFALAANGQASAWTMTESAPGTVLYGPLVGYFCQTQEAAQRAASSCRLWVAPAIGVFSNTRAVTRVQTLDSGMKYYFVPYQDRSATDSFGFER